MSAATLHGARTRPVAAARLNWRRVLGYSLLWGIACAALESFALPLGEIGGTDLLRFMAEQVSRWSITGVALVSVALWLEHRPSLPLMATVLVVFGLLACIVFWVFGKWWTVNLLTLRGNSAYIFWSAVVYGGMFLAAYRLSRQSERTRALLAQAEIAREKTETLFSEARLLSLQGHVDPAFLLRAVIEVQQRYAGDPAGMDRLLDRLVSFLRSAMPGVRSGTSTLTAELRLAEQYAQVWAELEPGRVDWCIRVDGAVPELPFPPLLLLPVLEQLAAASAPGHRGDVQVARVDDHCVLTLSRRLQRDQRWLAPELSYRLQVGLQALFGNAWTLTDEPDSPACVLTLPIDRPAVTLPVPPRPRSSTTHPETTHE
jgi:hypothetical protein